MAKIIINQNTLLIETDNYKKEFYNFFAEVNGEIVNLDKKLVVKWPYIKYVFNIQDLFFKKDKSILEKLVDFFNKNYESLNKTDLFIETSCILNNQYINSLGFRKVSINNRELIYGYTDIVEKFCDGDRDLFQEKLYGLMKKQVIDYMMEKIKELYSQLYSGEADRIKNVLSKNFYNIILECNKKNGKFMITVPVILKNKSRKAVDISLTTMDFLKIPVIKEIVTVKLSKESMYKLKEEFKATLIGIFTGGKSTMINAFVGQDILKTDVRAETAASCKIINSNQNNILAKYNDGKIEEHTYSNVSDLTEKMNKITSVREDGNNIKEVTIEYRNEVLPNVTLVDSPGLFSRYEHHDKLSNNTASEADMIIFIIDPLKIGDKNFTEVMKKNINEMLLEKKNFCFVLTKLDRYDEDKEKLLNEMNIVLKELNVDYVPVFFVSAYFALKAKMLRDNKISIDEIRKDRNIYVLDEYGDILSGKLLKQNHWKDMLKFSGIEELENYINEVREINECRML